LNLSELFSRKKKKRKPRTTTGSRSGSRAGKSQKKGTRSATGPVLLLVALLLVVLGVGALKWSRSREGQASLLALGSERMFSEVQSAVDRALAGAVPGFPAGPSGLGTREGDELNLDWLLPGRTDGAVLRCRLVDMPAELPFREMELRIARALQEAGAGILWAERLFDPLDRKAAQGPDEEKDLLRLDVGVKGHPTHVLVLRKQGIDRQVRWGQSALEDGWSRLTSRLGGPVVALVIDDWGQNRLPATRQLLDLPIPLTMAVLPGLPYSREFSLAKTDLLLAPGSLNGAAARTQHAAAGRVRRLAAGCSLEVGLTGLPDRVGDRRREILLHLPMEPEGYPEKNPGKQAIMVGMSRADISNRLESALRGLDGVTGVNNHMGSAATSHAATMGNLMDVLADRGLLFLDSLTSPRSVAYETAVEHEIPALKNRIFLDPDHEDEQNIKQKLDRLVAAARSGGFAVGIGHTHPATARVLAREVPRLVAQGVTFVTVSEMHALQQVARQEVLP
jgi:polysaccharide deacetylase 2 family uncharacterized protein YibQ